MSTCSSLSRSLTDSTCCQIFAIGQSIAVSIEANNGLGSHAVSLSAEKVDHFQKVLHHEMSWIARIVGDERLTMYRVTTQVAYYT